MARDPGRESEAMAAQQCWKAAPGYEKNRIKFDFTKRIGIMPKKMELTIRKKGMRMKHTFYPMVTQTMKTLLNIFEPDSVYELLEVINIITTYPNYVLDGDMAAKPIIIAIIEELDRQYERWEKGGKNGK